MAAHRIAKNLLEQGIASDIVVVSTGLTTEDVETIKAALSNKT